MQSLIEITLKNNENSILEQVFRRKVKVCESPEQTGGERRCKDINKEIFKDKAIEITFYITPVKAHPGRCTTSIPIKPNKGLPHR